MVWTIAITLLILLIAFFLIINLPQFGKAPSGERLARIKLNPNYKNGAFHNESFTPFLTEGFSMTGLVSKFIFDNNVRKTPAQGIPSQFNDIRNLSDDRDIMVWFGHSSYFLRINGVRFLIDPVFSGNASPFPFSNRSFGGSDRYKPEDMPEIDYLIMSHDHYDHLDYKTIIALKPKIKQVICPLGVGSHFEHWSFDPSIITELEWYQSTTILEGITLHAFPSRHFSGRLFNRSNTLWMSVLLETQKAKYYLGGDSGYDHHFKKIGDKFGPIDLAILDNGQYNDAWRAIHMFPEDVVRAAADLNAKRLFLAHSSKFALSQHDWDEPLNRITKAAADAGMPLVTPVIGEILNLNDLNQTFTNWWVFRPDN